MLFFLIKNTPIELSPRLKKMVNGAFWLVNLRWLAIVGVICVPFIAKSLVGVQVPDNNLLYIAACLVAENILILFILNYQKSKNRLNSIDSLKLLINFQIILDLIFLTAIIHFTGGIENPFYLFFIFHMVISSILLSKWNSYSICAFALILLCIQTYLEYINVFNHYSLWLNQIDNFHSYKNLNFIYETLVIFCFTSFLLVYMANTVVSLLRKQEKILHKANDQLLRKDTIKNEYVLRLTHDIKGHLAAIQINLSLIIDKILGELNEKQAEIINNINERSVRLSDFVNRLLNLTYMRLNNKIELEVFPIREAVISSVSLVINIAESKSMTLRYFIDDSLENITNNKFVFEELISSLLLNAIRYTPDNGKIDLVVKDKEDKVQIEISDSGIGIPQDETAHIFDEFYRASNAKKFKPHGTGLGLAIVKEIVQLYQGEIRVESKLDIGTSFFVVFPKNINIGKDTIE